jgi:NADH:ubiquinone oxidoreductase subunit 5 (subunit L)/multisubunit Na+/H+ antiporter MnhA subunit
MSLLLLAATLAPALGALATVLLRLDAVRAARLGIVAAAIAAAAAIGLAFAVGIDGPVELVATADDGDALVGVVADRVGAVLLVLTSAVGLIVQSFAARSLRCDPRARRFHVLAGLLVSSTMLVAAAVTASGLLVAWVATSVVLVALVGHKAPWKPALDAQRRTARSFAVGDVALLVAVIVGIAVVGDLDLRSIELVTLDAERIASIRAIDIVAVLLVVAGVARSALIPIHRWLPSTLAAPTPVSALLHAGVVNGAGVLLIRFSPVFASSVSAMALAFALGIATALVATAIMLVRTDVKGSLVWSTSGQMGFMVMQLGVGAFAAALFHIVGHALYKAAMFLGAGGAISAHQRQTFRPHLGSAQRATLTSTSARLAMGLLVPLAAFAGALLVIDPHLTAAATILIVVFGTLSVGRAANGWMAAAPFAVGRTVALSTIGVFVLAFGYIGGIAIFEAFVVDVVPYDVPAAVGPVWVGVVLAGIGFAAALVAFLPGLSGDQLRRRTYGWLVSTGANIARPVAGPSPAAANGVAPMPTTPRVNELVTTGDRP